MTHAHLGQKHFCSACNTRFYDLNKVPAVCPKCQTVSLLADKGTIQPPPHDATQEEEALETKGFFEPEPSLEDTNELDDGLDLRDFSSKEGTPLEENS